MLFRTISVCLVDPIYTRAAGRKTCGGDSKRIAELRCFHRAMLITIIKGRDTINDILNIFYCLFRHDIISSVYCLNTFNELFSLLNNNSNRVFKIMNLNAYYIKEEVTF